METSTALLGTMLAGANEKSEMQVSLLLHPASRFRRTRQISRQFLAAEEEAPEAPVLYSVDAGVCEITLNRGEERNRCDSPPSRLHCGLDTRARTHRGGCTA